MTPEATSPNPFADAVLASAYDSWFETTLGRLVDTYQWRLINRLCQPQVGESALDVGTGTGHAALRLAAQGLEVTGYDSSAEMLKVGGAKSGGEMLVGSVEWRQGKAEDLPYADGSFRLVLAVTALEFVQDRQRVLDEMWRVTAPGGRMVVAVLNSDGPWGRYYRRQAETQETPFRRAHLFSAKEFVTTIRRYGPLRWNSAVFFGPQGPWWRFAALLEWLGQRLAKGRGTLLVGRVDK